MKPFKSKAKKGFCSWCGDKLRKEYPEAEGVGYCSNNSFCSLRCGYQYGHLMISKGHIYELKK